MPADENPKTETRGNGLRSGQHIKRVEQPLRILLRFAWLMCAFAAGASGILFSIANANRAELSPADYAKLSAPFDKRFFAATASAKLNFLHLHWENEYVDQFVEFQAPVINWSVQSSGVSVSTVRSKFPQTIATGIDEKNYKDLSPEQIRNQ